MAEKKYHEITNRQFAFFIGVALCFLVIIMILNMWVVARILTFPFIYCLGISAYLIYLFLFIEGFSLIIKKKTLKIGFSLKFLGFVLTFLSLDLLFTAFYKPNYEILTYNDFFSGLDYIKNPDFLNLFNIPVAGGFLGITMFQALNTIGSLIPFIIGFLILFVGLAFIFMNPILELITNYQSKNKPKTHKNKEHKKEREKINNSDEQIIIAKDNSSAIIYNASKLDEPVNQQSRNEQISSKPNPARTNNDGIGIINDIPFGNNDNSFVPAHFVPGVIPGDTPSPMANLAKATVSNQNDTVNQTPNIESRLNESPKIEENKSEQLTLNFEEAKSPIIDEKLVTAAPVFDEPVAKKNNEEEITPAPAPKVKIKWVPPSLELLEVYEVSEANNANIEVADQRTLLINQIFQDYKVGAEVEGYTIGPSVTRYNVKYETNVQTRAVENVVKDVARRLGGVMCRFVPIVKGTEYSGLEIPNAKVTTVSFKDVFEKLPDVKKHPTAIAFGKDIQGDVTYADFNSFPHLLVAGTTGSGKSIFVHSIISTLIMRNSPEDLKLVLVDPKRVEMVKYRDIPHLLCPIINDPKKAKPLLDKLVDEMNDRYDLLAQGDGFSDIIEYNEYAEEHGLDKIPTIIAILDEYGDLVETCKEISRPVLLLGQKARACGIHVLIATQSPTSDIITGTIKSNLPTHVALATSNTTQSVTILGEGGAEKLLGRGDMLVQCPRIERGALTRLQGCYIANKEISRIAGYLREHYPTQYDEKFLNLEEEAAIDGQLFIANGGNIGATDDADEMQYQSIKEWVMSQQYTSMSRIQGDCSVGFNKARRIFNRLVQEGIVSDKGEGNKGCRVLKKDPRMEINSDDIPVSDELTD